jgi:hypothetical protein
VVLFALSLAVGVHDQRTGCSGDLRPYVAGARALRAGLDPYFYVWHPDMSERLAEYWSIPVKMTREAASPALLWLDSLTAGLAWSRIRWLHFGGEELAFVLLAVLLARLRFHRDDRARALCVFLVLVAIGCSPIWREHVANGQHYIQIALFLGLALACMDRGRPGWAGFWGAWAVLFRPTLAVLFLPLVLKRQWGAVAGAVVGAAVFLALSLPVTGIQPYRSAGPALAAWDTMAGLGYVPLDNNGLPAIPPGLRLDRPPTPAVLEGVRRIPLWGPPLEEWYSLLGVSNDLIAAANRLGAHLHPEPGSDWRLRACRGACVLLMLLAGVALVRWRGPLSGWDLLLVGLFLAFVADYMVPCERLLYSETLQALPFGVLGGLLLDRRLPPFVRWCGVVGAGWALASYGVRLLPESARYWVNIFSFGGPYAALVFFGGAVLYLLRRSGRGESEESSPATVEASS